jgi:hypothetical protein
VMGKGWKRANMEQIQCTHGCKRKKWFLLKLFQGWGERGIKENCGGSEFKYIWYIVRTFVNTAMYPHPD